MSDAPTPKPAAPDSASRANTAAPASKVADALAQVNGAASAAATTASPLAVEAPSAPGAGAILPASVKQMLAAAGITRALVIDNVFDLPGDDITHAQLQTFATAISATEALHPVAQHKGWPTNGTIPAGDYPADALWTYCLEHPDEPFAKLAQEHLFETRLRVYKNLNEFCELLGAREIHVDTAGVEGEVALNGAQVVFLDYMLEPVGVNPAEVGEIALSKVTSIYQGGARPLVLLISDLASLNPERRAQICAKVGECGGFFGFIKKQHLKDELILGLKLAQLGVGSATDGRVPIREFAQALKAATASAAAKMVEFVHQLELHDYVHLHQMRLHKDGHPMGDYIQSLCEATLAHELARDAGVVAKRTAVNELKFSGLMPIPPAPSAALHHGYHRVQTDPLDPALNGYVPPIFGNIYISENNEKAKMVLNAGCDLVANSLSARKPPADEQPVYFLEGRVEHVESPEPDDTVATTEALIIAELPSRIVWDLSSMRSVNYGGTQALLESGTFKFAFCLREITAAAIQRAAINHITRIGSMVSPPVEAAADITVMAGPSWDRLLAIGGVIAGGARMVDDDDDVIRCRLTIDGAIAVIERLREGIQDGTRDEPEFEPQRQLYQKREQVNPMLNLSYWLDFTKKHIGEIQNPSGTEPTILFGIPNGKKGRVKSFALVLARCHKGT